MKAPRLLAVLASMAAIAVTGCHSGSTQPASSTTPADSHQAVQAYAEQHGADIRKAYEARHPSASQ